MLNFFAGAFVVAGLLAAAGPIVIHLLNRRRYQTISWAAMDFLREAIQRNRRILQLRDLLLMVLRVLCVFLFGLALARPYFTSTGDAAFERYLGVSVALLAAFALAMWSLFSSSRGMKIATGAACLVAVLISAGGVYAIAEQQAASDMQAASSRAPVHAVLVIDNSLSMAYESLEGSLLDQARAKALDFLEQLPPESRVSVVPLCGAEQAFSFDAYRSREDAREALQRIAVVDRAGSALTAIELAAQACQQAPELPTKRVIFIGDQQVSNWPADAFDAALDRLAELQVVQVGSGPRENLWVSDFRVQDGVADIETPTVFHATVEYAGEVTQSNVQVTLFVDDVPVSSQTLELEPGQARELTFKHLLDLPADPGQTNYVRAEIAVEMTSGVDRLRNDNRRFLTVPVVAGLPVVFIDQYGAEENLATNRIGETYALRRLLAPRSSAEERHRQLIQIRHTTIDELDQSLLHDARLVVIAGVADPGPAVPLLRQYVQQGGQLIIAAGGQFDPAAWNDRAWLDGAGVLPTPLKSELLGETPEEAVGAETLRPWLLDVRSLHHPYFRLEGESDESLADLYRIPLFFKTAAVVWNDSLRKELLQKETERIEQQQQLLAERAQQEETQHAGQAQRLREIQPAWLSWQRERRTLPANLTPADLAQRSLPQVLATYDRDGLPCLVQRQLGEGRVLFFSSGTYSSWNTLTRGVAMVVFDRICRQLLEETLPQRTFEAGETITLPVPPGEQQQYVLTRPLASEEPLSVEALGPESYGLLIRNALRSGAYTVTTRQMVRDDPTLAGEKLQEIPLAVNGPARESDLRMIDAFELKERLGAANYRWIAADEMISLEGTHVGGRDLWKRLIQGVLLALGAEMLILAWPSLSQSLAQESAA